MTVKIHSQGQLAHDGFVSFHHRVLPGGRSAAGSPIRSTGEDWPAGAIVAPGDGCSNGGPVAAVMAGAVDRAGVSGLG